MRFNHPDPISFEVHPFSEVVYSQSGTDWNGNHVFLRFFSLEDDKSSDHLAGG
jgi:hypothetical protein